MSLLLGIDVGTSRVKALLYDAGSGKVLATTKRDTPVVHPRPEWSDFPPEGVWQAVVGAIRDLVAARPIVRSVRALSVSSLGESGVPLDGANRPLASFVVWYDRRTQAQADQWDALFSQEDLYRITGQRMAYSLGVNKWLWWRAAYPSAAARASHWLSMADWIIYRLSGELATDYTLAARTGLFNQQKQTWATSLIDAVNVPAGLLPEVVPSGTKVGHVTASAAETTGLPVGIAVVSGGHDHLCAAVAGGAVAPGTALDSTGTATAIVVPTTNYLGNAVPWTHGFACYSHVVPGLYVIRAGLKASGRAIEWLVRTLWGTTPDDQAYRTLLAEAAASSGARSGLFCHPAFLGTGTPDGDLQTHAALVGMTLEHTRGDIMRALLEGLAFWTRQNLDALEILTERSVDTVRLTGGSTRIGLLSQLKATISGRTIGVLDTTEGSALGAALLAGLGTGVFASAPEAFASLRLEEQVYVPDSTDSAIYDGLYHEVYEKLYPALSSIDRTQKQGIDLAST